MVTRQQLVETARSYKGTPFLHQGRLKGKGMDCVGLPLLVAGELGLVDKSGVPINGDCYLDYSGQPTGNMVHDLCLEHLVYKPVREMEPGDILTIALPSAPCHVAMVSELDGQPAIIHCYSGGVGKCIEHALDARWRKRIVGCFAYPEVID